jgi:hypothetical protein
MEELEARANRFVSHLVGSSVSEKPPPNSSKLHHSLLAVLQLVVWQVRILKEEYLRQQVRLARHSARWRIPRLGWGRIRTR